MYELLVAQELPTDPDTWAKTGGILGLIILFLLVGGAALVRWLVSHISELNRGFREHIDKQAEKHRTERAEWQGYYAKLYQQHREERQEWRESTATANESLRRSIETQQHEMAQEIERGLEKGLEKMFAYIDKRSNSN